MKIRWFNISAPSLKIGNLYIRPFTVFNRRCADGDHYWGISLLQIGKRHLFCVAFSGVSILFIGKVP